MLLFAAQVTAFGHDATGTVPNPCITGLVEPSRALSEKQIPQVVDLECGDKVCSNWLHKRRTPAELAHRASLKSLAVVRAIRTAIQVPREKNQKQVVGFHSIM